MTGANKLTADTRPAREGARRRPAGLRFLGWLPSLYIPAFVLVAAVAAGFIWHDLDSAYRRTLAAWSLRLSTAAESRVRTADLWRNERRMNIEVLARDPATVRFLGDATQHPPSAADSRQTEAALTSLREGYGYLAGAVMDRQCRFAAQSGVQPGFVQPLGAACRLVRQGGGFRLDAFGMEHGDLKVTLAGPVLAEAKAAA